MSSTLVWVHQMVSENTAYLGHLPTRKFTEKKKAALGLKTFDTESLDLLQIGTSIPFTFCSLYFSQMETFVLKLYSIVGLCFLNANIYLDYKHGTIHWSSFKCLSV